MISRKRKLLKLGIMCLMPLLALLITISNSYAYYVNSDGNLESNNVAIEYVNNGWSCSINFDAQANTTYSLKASGTSSINEQVYIQNNGSIIQQIYSPNSYSSSIVDGFHFTTSNNVSGNVELICRFNVYVSTLNNVMLNVGNEYLSYEPYGIWYSTDNAYQPLNIAFNDCRVELLNYNVSTHNVVATTNLSISNSQLITLDNIPSLKTIIDNDEDTRYGLKFYLNNPINYILNFQMNNNVYQVFVALSNSVTGQSFTFEYGSNVENYNLVCNTNNNYYDTILYYTLLSPDYNYFSMYVNTDSASFNSGYGVGYAEGYDEGYDNGHYTGYNTGIHENGEYQRGYNDGIQQDLASSGFRTLITTILSYPVNMVRESLNFEFMGIHVASIVLFIVSLGIVAFVIKRFKD